MARPEYLICLNCEAPAYVFEWKDEKATEAICEVCANDDPDSFLSQQDWEEMVGG